MPLPEILFDGQPLRLEAVVALARGQAVARLSDAPTFVRRIDAGAEFVARLLAEDGVVYGITTGYGDSCTVSIPPALVEQLPTHLYTYHGCGAGALLSPEQTRAVLAVRLQSLAQGVSGVSYALLKQLAALLEHDILPQIPSEGSVGASGDLTPLSYVAAVLCGERQVWFRGESMPAAQALAAVGLQPHKLRAQRRSGHHERHGRDDGPGLPGLGARRPTRAAGHPLHGRQRGGQPGQCPPFRRDPVRGQAAPGPATGGCALARRPRQR